MSDAPNAQRSRCHSLASRRFGSFRSRFANQMLSKPAPLPYLNLQLISGMRSMPDLESIFGQISAELAEEGVETILLSHNQMLVRKHMISRASPQGFKTPTLEPAPDGYAVYVRCTSPDADKGHPEQRLRSTLPPIRWNPATMKLHLARAALDQGWQLLIDSGHRVSLTVYCGSEQVFDEVDRVLAVVASFLLK